jgi:rubrerythrin
MPPSKRRHKVIELLARHEEAVGRLYAAYADRFPAQRALWSKLSDEESQHAEWIRGLDPVIKEKAMTFRKDRFKADAIDKSMAWVTFQTGKAQSKDVPLDEALTVAMDLENGMIENKWFEVFSDDPPEFKTILRSLAKATETHRTRVQRTWKKIGKADRQRLSRHGMGLD